MTGLIVCRAVQPEWCTELKVDRPFSNTTKNSVFAIF